eukprot:s1031_g11.t1
MQALTLVLVIPVPQGAHWLIRKQACADYYKDEDRVLICLQMRSLKAYRSYPSGGKRGSCPHLPADEALQV